jgi:hypothetical protein
MKRSASVRAAAAYSAIVGRAWPVVGGSAGCAGSSEWFLSRRRTMGPRECVVVDIFLVGGCGVLSVD